MPELPEVETIKNDLQTLVRGRRIDGVNILDPKVVKHSVDQGFAVALEGEQIKEVRRRAKYLLLELSSGRYLVVQLMLTGQLLLVEPDEPLRPNTRLIFDLDHHQQLRLVDSRHFARVHLVEPSELSSKLHLDKLGPEPLEQEFAVDELARRLRGRTAAIKSVLLDQHIVAGIGNIYSDEILFKARINPAEPAGNIKNDGVRRLHLAIRETLHEGIIHRGTTTQAYRDVAGRKGEHQNFLAVHGRLGQPCPGCAGEVTRTTIVGRDTYFCPSCQVLSSEAAKRRQSAA